MFVSIPSCKLCINRLKTHHLIAKYALMKLNDLELLVTVGRLGNFAMAARAHKMDPSNISRAIANIEREIGAKLFHRTTRKLSVTAAGQRYLDQIIPLLDGFKQAGEIARNETANPQGTLRLTTSTAFGERCLVPLLADYQRRFPQIELELILTDTNVDLTELQIDLAIRLAPQLSGDLICTKLMTTGYHLCASPDYLASAGAIETLRDASRRKWLVFALPDFSNVWKFRDRSGAVHEVPIHPQLAISNAGALHAAALEGLGPAMLADWLIKTDLEQGRLVKLMPEYEVTATTYDTAAWLVFPDRSFLPAKTRQTIDFLKARFAGN